MNNIVERAENVLHHSFGNREILVTALTHSSYANENRGTAECNERLEFLGDAVLSIVVADYLYRNYPDIPEGKMTRLRAELVCEQALYKVAVKLGIGQWLRLGRGEEKNSGRERPSILSDAVEAIIAALYLDAGPDKAAEFIREHVLSDVKSVFSENGMDFKTALQEVIQKTPGSNVSYVLVRESGPDHNKSFTIRAVCNGKALGEGTGRTKKEAEQQAARHALEEVNR